MDHPGHPVHVDPSGGDIGRHQHAHPARAERRQRALTLTLAPATVDRLGRHPAVGELLRQPVGAVLGAHEDDGRPTLAGQLGTHGRPVGQGHRLEPVRHLGEVILGSRHLVTGRIALVATDEDVHGPVERRREQERLAVGRRRVENPAHGWQEPHVGHPVCLVHDDELHVGEIDSPLSHQVLEPAGTGDGDVDATGQGAALASEADATEEGVDAQLARGQQWTEGVGDLGGELPGRRKDQPPGLAGSGP